MRFHALEAYFGTIFEDRTKIFFDMSGPSPRQIGALNAVVQLQHVS
jgi:hypothetical protein